MAEEWIIVCNCGEQTWLLCGDRVVCAKCKAEHRYDDVMDTEPLCNEIIIDMETTNRVVQMVDLDELQ